MSQPSILHDLNVFAANIARIPSTSRSVQPSWNLCCLIHINRGSQAPAWKGPFYTDFPVFWGRTV